ncbi:MAG: zinc ribbon domain-containing protein, partial [Christensenellaceae bacterium]
AIIDKETFLKAQTLLRSRQEQHYTPVSTTYPFSKKIKCGHCGDIFRRISIHDKVYWVCYQHSKGKSICPITQIPEQTLYRAFVRMYNKLHPAADQILGTMLEQLYSLRTSQNKNNVKIAEINKEIANLTEQNHVMNDLKVKNLIDSAFFIAQANELSHKIRKLRIEKSRLMESEDDDELLTGTRNLLDFFKDSSEVITEFDADAFEQMVDKIIIDSNEKIRFRLINGLELTEKTERTVRLYAPK